MDAPTLLTVTEVYDNVRAAVAGSPAAFVGAGVLLLVAGGTLLVRRLAQAGKSRWARTIQVLSTTLGLTWSALGMYDAATDRYGMNEVIGFVLCSVFELMLLNRMFKAEDYRDRDRSIRDRHVRVVWVFGVVMAVVVATAEGWAQAPARLAIPLLVVSGWFFDLTGDDNPAEQVETQWRWTPRELGLALRLLKRRDSDRKSQSEADRDYLLARLVRLGFRDRLSPPWVNEVLNRRARLGRLAAQADAELMAKARVQIARAVAVAELGLAPAPDDVPDEQEKADIPEPPKPTGSEPLKIPRSLTAGTRIRVSDGQVVTDYRADAVELHRQSQTPDRPKGMKASELAACYRPPIGQRYADECAATARKLGPSRINGHQVDDLIP